MKRFLCLVTVLCLVCSVASADLLEDFNTYASVFGCTELKNGVNSEGLVFYETGECTVTFKEEEAIYVYGGGELFIPYCAAAIMAFEQNSNTFSENCGNLLTNYLLARGTGEQQSNITTGGCIFGFTPIDNGFIFLIKK